MDSSSPIGITVPNWSLHHQLTVNPEEFDNTYMRALYHVGYDSMLKGFPWLKVPPGFRDDSAAD
jgi:hypothetical protein